nr:winged helix-turn-helix domain-containing protein [Kribbella capetownensis]
MATMAARPHRVFTRAQLLETLHGIDTYITSRTIDTRVLNLRKKIEPAHGDRSGSSPSTASATS